MRLMLTLHPQLLEAIDAAKRYDESRASYIRECIRQRLQREQQANNLTVKLTTINS